MGVRLHRFVDSWVGGWVSIVYYLDCISRSGRHRSPQAQAPQMASLRPLPSLRNTQSFISLRFLATTSTCTPTHTAPPASPPASPPAHLHLHISTCTPPPAHLHLPSRSILIASHAVLSLVLLEQAPHMLLNAYSTFSQLIMGRIGLRRPAQLGWTRKLSPKQQAEVGVSVSFMMRKPPLRPRALERLARKGCALC